jgi:hypothetical protein
MSTAFIRPATPADATAIAEVRVNAWRTTYKGMIPDAYLAAMKIEDSAALVGKNTRRRSQRNQRVRRSGR